MIFFTCSLIEYIARKTHNYRSSVVNALGRKRIEHNGCWFAFAAQYGKERIVI